MTLDAMVLQKIGSWRPSGSGRQSLTITDPESGWGIQLVCDQHAELGIALWELELRRSGVPVPEVNRALGLWAQHLSKVTSLTEPLHIVEIDQQRAQALIRSREPTPRDGAALYYEILLNSDRGALVRRYRTGTPLARREQRAFVLTHEALANLVGDIVSGLQIANRPD